MPVKHLLAFALTLLLFSQTVTPLLAQEQRNLNLTATVPADQSDFAASIEQLTAGTTFNQDETIEYRLTYSSFLDYTVDITPEVEWSLGTIAGSGTPSVEVLEYVIGSASNGYNSTAPVVDLTNRKITWPISNFPANTTATVTFSLRTTDNYTGSSDVAFSVSGRVHGPGVTTADSTVTATYQYFVLATPTPTPTAAPGPSATPGPGPTATPTPITKPEPFQFTSISFQTLSFDQASILVSTNTNSTATIQYGTTRTNLSQRLTSLARVTMHRFDLTELSEDTVYFFRVTATDLTGKTIRSDLFTFKTAKKTDIPQIDLENVVITSSKQIVFISWSGGTTPFAIIPKSTPFEFQISFTNPRNILRVTTEARNLAVLGLNNSNEQAISSKMTELIEVTDGVYVGTLLSSATPGLYGLFARIYDTKGNIIEQKFAEIKVLAPLTIREKGSNTPIENAKAEFFIYNSRLKKFVRIPPESIAIKNPSYSEVNGEVLVVLPLGTYKAAISALNYAATEVTFTIGPGPDQNFPEVYLDRKDFSLLETLTYYTAILVDWSRLTTAYLQKLSTSNRFFNFIITSSMILTAFLTFLAFTSRSRIPLTSLPAYLLHSIHHLSTLSHGKKTLLTIAGSVCDEKNSPVQNAYIFLLNNQNQVLTSTRSDKSGTFLFRNLTHHGYKISVLKDSFASSPLFSVNETAATHDIVLQKNHDIPYTLTKDFARGLKRTLDALLELLLIATGFFLVLFIQTFGVVQMIPFLLLFGVNIYLWFIHGQALRRHRV